MSPGVSGLSWGGTIGGGGGQGKAGSGAAGRRAAQVGNLCYEEA
jgi:hypothetical protein